MTAQKILSRRSLIKTMIRNNDFTDANFNWYFQKLEKCSDIPIKKKREIIAEIRSYWCSHGRSLRVVS